MCVLSLALFADPAPSKGVSALLARRCCSNLPPITLSVSKPGGRNGSYGVTDMLLALEWGSVQGFLSSSLYRSLPTVSSSLCFYRNELIVRRPPFPLGVSLRA